MIVVFDSIQYENTGRLIYQKGWLEFFRTGPHREPLYPALIAASMALADRFSTNYQLILKIFQVAFLFLTQILLLVLLLRINVRGWIAKGAVLYAGISPGMINAAYSVYYEIVSFPFVVAVVLLASSLWSDVHQKRKYRVIFGKTFLFGVCFGLLALGRGVFEYVFYFFVLPFCITAFFSFFKQRPGALPRVLVFISVACLIVFSITTGMKKLNSRYNGQYVFAATHLSILLGSAYKRSQPLTSAIVGSHIATIPGTGVCQRFFSKEECKYADWFGADGFRVKKVLPMMALIPKDQQEFEVLRLTLEKIVEHPLKYLFFSVVEALKMPFWESTKIGFVSYPTFLTKAYNHPLMRFGLRAFLSFLTIFGFVYVSCYILRNRWRSAENTIPRQDIVTLSFIWLMIAAYTVPYALCYVITRYSLPIAALYIACIAFAIKALSVKMRAPRPEARHRIGSN